MADKYVYPVDVNKLVAACRDRGGDFVKYLAPGDERDDYELTKIVWTVGKGWFPVDAARKTHLAVDIGIPYSVTAGASGNCHGMEVRAVADGEVLYSEDVSWYETDCGRVLVMHQAPDGKPFYALYYQLGDVYVNGGDKVKAGQALGPIGWSFDFPHLSFAIAARHPFGEDKDLVPEVAAGGLSAYKDDSVWNFLRVKVTGLDSDEWPDLPSGNWWLFNPIEFVRWCRGEPYQHDISGPRIAADVDTKIHGFALAGGSGGGKQTIPGVLTSVALKGNPAIALMAQDPASAPIVKGHADKEAAKCVQRSLAHFYNMGSSKYDDAYCAEYKTPYGAFGIDGSLGNTSEKAIKHFQTEVLSKMDVTKWGRAQSEVQVSGKIDWLTLVALDIAVTDKEKLAKSAAPATTTTPPAASEPAARPGPPSPPPADTSKWVFDSTKGQSLKFGMLLYRALLRWELKRKPGVTDAGGELHAEYDGCGYSLNTREPPYETLFKAAYADASSKIMEWPDVSLNDVPADAEHGFQEEVTINDPALGPVKRRKIKAFHLAIVAGHYTNCCLSQMAALYCALGGGKIQVHRAGRSGACSTGCKNEAHTDVYPMSTANKPDGKPAFTQPKAKIKKGAWAAPVGAPWAMAGSGVEAEQSALWIFNDAFNTVLPEARMATEGPYANKLIEDKKTFGGMLGAVRWLGMGDAVKSEDGSVLAETFAKGTDTKILRELRLGDWANTPGHAWLVSEVRYGIWLEGNTNKEKPDFVLDQTSFVDKQHGVLKVPSAGDLSVLKYGGTSYIDPAVTALNEAQCDAIFKDEKAFDDKVRAFIKACEGGTLNAEGGKAPDGRNAADLKVKEIKVINLKEFSSNAIWDKGNKKFTLRGKVYVNGSYTDAGKTATINNTLARGVSRAWITVKPGKELTFARCYDCKS